MTKSPEPPQLSDRNELGPNDLDRQRIRSRIEKALALGMFSDTALRVDQLLDEHARLATRTSAFGLAKVIVPTLVLGVAAGALWTRQHIAAPPRAAHVQATGHTAEAVPAPSSEPEQTTARPVVSQPSAAESRQAAAASSSAATKRRATAPVQTAAPVPAPAKNNRSTKNGSHERTGGQGDAPTAPSDPAQASAAPFDPEPEGPAAPASARHLAEELRMMRAASAALHAEDYAAVHRLLRDHELRFAHGALAQERRALGLIALCKQGLVHTVRAEIAAFLRAETASPLARQVRQACETAR
jgi:hypothetical protein